MKRNILPPRARRARFFPHSRPRWSPYRLLTLGLAISLLPADALAQRRQAEPETATGIEAKALAVATRHMVSAANPYASQAGREILRAGGSAIDAAIATQLVLGLVEPQSSGLGGGAFILSYDAKARKLTSYDGRETAPATAKPDRFLKDGKPLPFDTAVRSGLSIGTPGLVRLLSDVHKKHGKLSWAQLFEPAIKLAENGFSVSPRLSFMLFWNGRASFAPAAQSYFFDASGNPWVAGHVLKNPQYASTLRDIAGKGADAFYKGAIAEGIVTAARTAPNASGDLTLADLANYRVEEREPVCVSYRRKQICGMGPPSSGGVAIAQILTMLDAAPLPGTPGAKLDIAAMHTLIEVEKLAYADRDRYLADPGFAAVPLKGLLDNGYLKERRKLFDPDKVMEKPAAGIPPGVARRAFGGDATLERAGTSHISIIDGDGNAVSMTTTIEGAFGSGVWSSGFLLNNELTDFSFQPVDADGVPIANRIEPGKRPRSTMAPTIVFSEAGEVEAVLGSPGGSRIIFYVAKTLVGMIDLGLDPQAAAALPNFGSQGGPVDLEMTWRNVLPALRLRLLGHNIRADLLNSGIHVVARRNGQLEGGADPRREGVALGD